MKNARFALVGLSLVLAGVIESTWLSMLGFPGAVPPLTLVVVFSLSQRRLPANAAVVGFIGGLVMDIMPPSATPMGVSAFAFAAVAFVASGVKPFIEGSGVLALAAIASAAAISLMLRIAVSIAVSSPQDVTENFLGNLLSSAAYAVMLAVIVLPVAKWFDTVITPRPATSIVR